jgi:hypothetical protein
MAGFDAVDPAYACLPPVSFAAPLHCPRITITPNSFLTTRHPATPGLSVFSIQQKLPLKVPLQNGMATDVS